MTQRRLARRGLVAALLLAAVALVVGTATAGLADGTAEPHLPTAVNAPGTWSEDTYVAGPVAALGVATRTVTRGLFDSRETLSLFAVSATDGSASWLDLPWFSLDSSGLVGGFAVSPDGRWIGWVRQGPGRHPGPGRIAGWAVLDTGSGEIQRLDVPGAPVLRATVSDLAFSGDSRHLLTSYQLPGRSHQFDAWDVEDGTRTVLEKPGERWLPNLGSAPSGVVWARGRTVFRVEPGAGPPVAVTLPQRVVTASWGPDDRSFAYVGRPATGPGGRWRLYAGSSVDDARDRAIRVPGVGSVSQLLGWVDATHVVVGHYRSTVTIVDLDTGKAKPIDLAGNGDPANAPVLAEALWQRPLVPPAEARGTSDPRAPWRAAGGLFLIALVLVGLVVGLRRTQRATPSPVRVEVVPVASLRPLATAAWGLVLVGFDLRFDGGLDLVPDPIGWAVAAVALGRLAPVHRGFHLASIVAWVALLPSLPDELGLEHPVITILVAVALLALQVLACDALEAVDPARSASARSIRRLTLGLSAALVVVLLLAAAEPDAGALALAIGLADLAVFVWFVVLLWLASRDGRSVDAETWPAYEVV